MTSSKDQILIKRSIAGDRLAQGEIYKRYVQAMYHTSIRFVKETNLAKDLTQDVFIKVFQELNKFRGEATLGAWIKRITINTCLNFLKKQGQLNEQELDEAMLLIQDEEEKHDEINMKTHLIHEAIKSLPCGCRTVFNLFIMEGYQHQEISEILNISVSTSKSQYHRAKRLLRQHLKHLDRNER